MGKTLNNFFRNLTIMLGVFVAFCCFSLAFVDIVFADEDKITGDMTSADASEGLEKRMPEQENKIKKRSQKKREKALKKQARREQSELIKKAKESYREAVSAYKAKSFEYSRDQLNELKKVLDSTNLPDKFRKKMLRKYNFASEQFENYKQKNANRRARIHQKKLERDRAKQQKLEKDVSRDVVKEVKYDAVTQKQILPAEKKTIKIDEKKKLRLEERQRKKEERYRLKAMKRRERERKKAVAKQQRAEAQRLRKLEKYMKRKKVNERRAVVHLEKVAAQKQKKAERAIERYRYEQTQKQKEVKNALDLKLGEMYQEGVQAFADDRYDHAWEVFQEVDEIEPGYKLTGEYIRLIKTHRRKSMKNILKNNSASRNEVIADTLDFYEMVN